MKNQKKKQLTFTKDKKEFNSIIETIIDTEKIIKIFKKTLINVLVNIELVLASILKNNKNGDMKNE